MLKKLQRHISAADGRREPSKRIVRKRPRFRSTESRQSATNTSSISNSSQDFSVHHSHHLLPHELRARVARQNQPTKSERWPVFNLEPGFFAQEQRERWLGKVSPIDDVTASSWHRWSRSSWFSTCITFWFPEWAFKRSQRWVSHHIDLSWPHEYSI